MTTHHTAQGLASLGRHGDTMLVHMSPHEVAGLNYLAKKQGTKLTINPETGLPEAFSLGGFFSSLLPMVVGAAVPGSWGAMAPLLAGAATGAGLSAAKGENPLMGGIMGGLGGYSGAGLANSLGAAAAPGGGWFAGKEIAGSALPNAAGMADSGAMSTVGGAGNIGMATNPAFTNAANTVAQTGVTGSALSGSGNIIDPALNRLSQAGTGLKNIATGQPGAWDAFKAAGGSGMKLAMPVGGAILGGLEPSDIYGNPVQNQSKDKYDPYATLRLNNDTGLRLVAKGGYIDGYAMGGTVTTGGLRDLYATTDSPSNPQLSRDGYGVGRLESLARQQSMNQAETTGYAMGGPISFADGGDTNPINKEIAPVDESMGIASLTPTTPNVPGQAMPAEQVQNAASALSNTASSDSGIIAQVATNLRNDPNYQPKNPIEAAIAKQIKGTDQTQQGQGLGSLGAQPSQPMAPTYNASQPIGATYYAGMNAPRGFADGGGIEAGGGGEHLNLDQLPTLNVNTGEQIAAGKGLSRLKELNPIGALYNIGFGGMLGNQIKVADDADSQNFFYGTQSAWGDDPQSQALRRLSNSLSLNPVKPSGTVDRAKGGYLDGQGDGMSDSIPATIEGKQPARLADGEFVVPADVVSHIGNGSSKAGSQRLYSMLDRVRKARTGHTKQGKEIKPEKYMPA